MRLVISKLIFYVVLKLLLRLSGGANADINAIYLICVSLSIKMARLKCKTEKSVYGGAMKDNQLLYDYPRIGVAAIVTHQHKVLFGKRIVANGDFVWQLPGGWIELGESPVQAARRELLEETGLGLNELSLVGLTNNQFSDQNHSISLYFEAECDDAAKLINREPGRCKQWVWMDWLEVENNLFLPLQLLKDTDYRPFISDKRGIHISI